MDMIVSGKEDELNGEIEARREKRAATEQVIAAAGRGVETTVAERSDVATDMVVPTTPFFGDRIVDDIDLDEVYPYINTIALFRGQWQFKKAAMSDDEYQKMLDEQVIPIFERLKRECKARQILEPRVVYGYYPCNSDGNDLIVYDAVDHGREVERFSFPRQPGRKRLCISDFFRDVSTGQRDVLGLSCVTMGPHVTVRTKELFESNEYTEYLYLHGIGVEAAEGLAEYWHKRMRTELGIGGDDAGEIRKLFTQKYRGSRYSFGYPACPDMSDQEKLFRLLKPQRIGCELTENWQIDPEQSTSAIIVHHPQAKYFNV
jgi:5-methyltetrahydrofolate--homocysteine methyltransferase